MKKIILFLTILTCFCLSINTANAELYYQSLAKNIYVSETEFQNCHKTELDHQSWPKLQLSEIQEFKRYCLRIPVSIEEENQPPHIQLQIYALASSRVFWDGEWLGNSGVVGDNAEQEQAGAMALKLPLAKTQLKAGEHLLSLDISTHSHLEDMHQIFYVIALLDDGYLNQLERLQLITPLLLMGGMLLLFIFFLLMYRFYQKDKNFIFFSLLCLFSGSLIGLEILKFFYAYP